MMINFQSICCFFSFGFSVDLASLRSEIVPISAAFVHSASIGRRQKSAIIIFVFIDMLGTALSLASEFEVFRHRSLRGERSANQRRPRDRGGERERESGGSRGRRSRKHNLFRNTFHVSASAMLRLLPSSSDSSACSVVFARLFSFNISFFFWFLVFFDRKLPPNR